MKDNEMLKLLGIDIKNNKIVYNKTGQEYNCVRCVDDDYLYVSDTGYIRITEDDISIRNEKYFIKYFRKSNSLMIQNENNSTIMIERNIAVSVTGFLTYFLEINICNYLDGSARKKLINDLRKISSEEVLPNGIISYNNEFGDAEVFTNLLVGYLYRYLKDYDKYEDYVKDIIRAYIKNLVIELINFREIYTNKIIDFYEKSNEEILEKINHLQQKLDDNNKIMEDTIKVKKLSAPTNI